ncbi:glycosyltransferase [Aequorivita sp. H23M31]|uniref:Glycosyltransferase n=1 Tax=Aequorivita ciconiae TaxID=2494375 RepID=A0A410G1Z1_9FLAO|nr:glycosyltransferase [Aequorivita sp. H23M31]QAA81298.1 glycosyltransferase [Aequorivita sp. H23M31]
MEKKKLLFIVPAMWGGGAERVLINLINLLDSKEYTIDLMTVIAKGELWDSIPANVNKKHANINPYIIQGLSLIFRRTNINLFWLLGYKFRGTYDVGISFLDSIFTELLFGKQLKLNKKIAVVHSSYKSYTNRSKFIKGKYKIAMCERYDKLDKIICVSKESKSEFIELFGDQYDVEVIYNPINVPDIVQKSREGIPEEMKRNCIQFVAVGSLNPVKGFDLLIRTSALLKNKGYNFHLHILGDGALRNQLEQLINDLDLKAFVSLHGFKKNPYPWIKNADVFIMSSIVEGLPTVLCESLILGKAVIVSNVPGCRELIDNGKFGIMCERDENQYFQAMAKCISEPAVVEVLRNNAIERSKIFSDEIVMEKYNSLFQV